MGREAVKSGISQLHVDYFAFMAQETNISKKATILMNNGFWN
tara:strand:- start:16 stop:141 length:126 start_codon:yes stop_codon:yes gene_type:complete